jgi:hypothetical protein
MGTLQLRVFENGITACSPQEEVADEEIHVISFEQREPWKLDATVKSCWRLFVLLNTEF